MAHDPFAEFRGTSFGDFSDPSVNFDFNQFTQGGSTADLGIFGDILESQPEIPFQGALQRANLTPNLLQQFQGERRSIFNQFQGFLDQQIQQGLAPSLRFGDFVRNFDFQRESLSRPPSTRFGADVSRFAPRTSVFSR